MNNSYAGLVQRIKDIGRLRSVSQLLDWDQETQMPPRGVAARAEQMSLIAGLAHEQLVSDETRRLLDETDPTADDFVAQTNLRETRRVFERSVRVPTVLVKEIAHASTLAKDAWAGARKESRFESFAPHLGTLTNLKKRLAEHIGYETEPYDALMDEFEPGAKSAQIEQLFGELCEMTVALLQRLAASKDKPDPSILHRHFPKDRQEKLSRRVAESINFDFERGRADVSTHPFCTTIGGCGDVRITTRYMEDFLPAALFGTMHEVGHALYEQGLPSEHMFTPMAEAVSLGIHESQSRMWENFVGRSRAFWTCYWPEVQRQFPEALDGVTLHQFYGAINTVTPSFIRVEADELTYNLHIILRFELERALFNNEIDVRDVPSAWNERVRKYLEISPPNDREGCLQDIHWSLGAFGYFPTYALGNLYAAQFFGQAGRDIPDLLDRISRNDHKPLLSWLREKIHGHGQRYRADELVQRVTGRPLSIEPFREYVTEKFERVYGLR